MIDRVGESIVLTGALTKNHDDGNFEQALKLEQESELKVQVSDAKDKKGWVPSDDFTLKKVPGDDSNLNEIQSVIQPTLSRPDVNGSDVINSDQKTVAPTSKFRADFEMVNGEPATNSFYADKRELGYRLVRPSNLQKIVKHYESQPYMVSLITTDYDHRVVIRDYFTNLEQLERWAADQLLMIKQDGGLNKRAIINGIFYHLDGKNLVREV